MSRRTRTLIVTSIVAALVLTAVAGWAGYVRFVRGVPLIDEWQCSDGEVPVVYAEGGSVCIDEGEEPPTGASLDPLGNRPFYPGKRPPYRPDVPCHTNKLPNLNGPAAAKTPPTAMTAQPAP